jgi:hypothetical protein
MAPRKDPIPRKRSRSMVRFEPTDTTLIEQNPNHVDSFKRMGRWRFCQNLEGHHLEVSRDFLQNYKKGKTQVGPFEIQLKTYLIVEVTYIPRTRELWFKEKKLEKEDRCQDMLKLEHRGSNLVKGVPSNWMLEEHDKLLLIIQIFLTCEGRYSWIL